MAGLLDTQGIENFYDAAIRQDFIRDFNFRVISLGGARFTNDELLYLTAVQLPGRSIVQVPAPFMGLEFRVPGAASYNQSDSWSVTFRCPANASVRRKLEEWTKYIFDDATSTGAYNIPDKSEGNTIILVMLDKQGNPIRTYKLYGAFCTNAGDMTFDQTGNGHIVTVPVTVAYQYWRLAR